MLNVTIGSNKCLECYKGILCAIGEYDRGNYLDGGG